MSDTGQGENAHPTRPAIPVVDQTGGASPVEVLGDSLVRRTANMVPYKNAGRFLGDAPEDENKRRVRSAHSLMWRGLYCDEPFTGTWPDTVFVSYMFEAPETRDRIVSALPLGVTYWVPTEELVGPKDLVSTAIIARIRGSGALVFSADPVTWASWWVPFECDVALRAGKPVLALDPPEGRFYEYLGSPLDVPTVAFWVAADESQVLPILHHMVDDRGIRVVNLTDGPTDKTSGNRRKKMLRMVWDQGGYPVAFWSRAAFTSQAMRDCLSLAGRVTIMYAHLEPVPSPGPMAPQQLYPGNGLSTVNLVDNMIVALHWLCRRNQLELSAGRSRYL